MVVSITKIVVIPIIIIFITPKKSELMLINRDGDLTYVGLKLN